MREIKFRGWDKEKKEMYTGFSFNDIYAGYDEIYVEDESDNYWSCPDWDNAILMQYTGLKDKNGKEIYEGDIIKNEIGELKEIIFEDGGFWYKDVDGRLYMPIQRMREIIGNIYENPEFLLKEEK